MNKRRMVVLWVTATLLAAIPTPGFTQEPAPAQPPGNTLDDTRGKLVVTFFDMSGGLSTPVRTRHLGLAVMLETPSGATYLYDTGTKYPPVDNSPEPAEFDTGRDCIAPLLESKGIDVIDGIVISHGHGDHHGGARYLLDHFSVRRIIHPVLTLPEDLLQGQQRTAQVADSLRRVEELIKMAKEKGVEDCVVTAGDKLGWDPALTVEVLSPPKGFLTSKVSIENANSLVLRVCHGKNVFLFTGDALAETQEHLIRSYPAGFLKTTVMSAPHHGYDCYGPFALTRPEVVVISCGTRGAPERVARTKAVFDPVGAKIYVTPWHGAVQVVSDGTAYTVKTERSHIATQSEM